MKISNELKIFVGILLISLAVPIVTAASQPNDYIAFVFAINDFQSKDDSKLDVYYPVGYIPVTGSVTYTYTRANLVTEINLSQPTKINSLMKATIVAFANSKGYNLKKIVYQDYNVANP